MMALAGRGTLPASADPPPPPGYRQAVENAYQLVRSAAAGDAAAAQKAEAALRAGTGPTQPEIIDDLRQKPPDLIDAKARLLALLAALNEPADTADPAAAQQRLHDVLAMPRYDALHRPPSLLDRFVQWVGDRINQLLRLLFGAGRGRFAEGVIGGQPTGPRAPADYFAEADALAARGDRVGAIRALCAGVAGTLSGERTWEGSPLTVREIFQRAPDPAHLRPLLMPFEAAVYGGRDVDAATYERAARVAAPFRRPASAAA